MAKIYCDANPTTVAYVLVDGDSGYQNLPPGYTSMQAEYLAIIYGLNSYFNKWSKELDERDSLIDTEASKAMGQTVFTKVSSPSAQTPRPLPPPILVCSDNEVVVKQLSRQYHIGNKDLLKLAQQVWQMTQNVSVTYQWIPRAENIAGKMLK